MNCSPLNACVFLPPGSKPQTAEKSGSAGLFIPRPGGEKGPLCSLYLAYRLCLGCLPSSFVVGWFSWCSLLGYAVCNKCWGHWGSKVGLALSRPELPPYFSLKSPMKSEPPPSLLWKSKHSLRSSCLPGGVVDVGFPLPWSPDASAVRGSGLSGSTGHVERRKLLSETRG